MYSVTLSLSLSLAEWKHVYIYIYLYQFDAGIVAAGITLKLQGLVRYGLSSIALDAAGGVPLW